PWIEVPEKLAREERAPDSIQFNLVGMSDDQVRAFATLAAEMGVGVQVFGMSADNARAFWNWQFLPEIPDLPKTRAMLMRACDVRLPVRLTRAELDVIADILLEAAERAVGPQRAYGT
ncbi:MAG: aminotransferase, partial [Deltaproteobacteria bacterium]